MRDTLGHDHDRRSWLRPLLAGVAALLLALRTLDAAALIVNIGGICIRNYICICIYSCIYN